MTVQNTLYDRYGNSNPTRSSAKELLRSEWNNSPLRKLQEELRAIDAAKSFITNMFMRLTTGSRIIACQPRRTRSTKRTHRKAAASGDSDCDPAPRPITRNGTFSFLSSIAATVLGGAQ